MNRIAAAICVAGGGPSGTTVARQLAEMGHDVVLLEAQVSERPHPAATLPASALNLLSAVNAREEVIGANFFTALPTLVNWPFASQPSGSESDTTAMGLHVRRDLFDRILLNNARRSGVHVRLAARAGEPAMCDASGKWKVVATTPAGPLEVGCQILLDATGRGLIRNRQVSLSAPTIALYAVWSGPEEHSGSGHIRANANEWFWLAPVSKGQSIAVVFVDPKRLTRLDPIQIRQLYLTLLNDGKVLSPHVHLQMVTPVRVCDATSRVALTHATTNYIKVGDASLKLDPLSSQGVQAAVASGLQAAIIANTILRRPESAQMAADFYQVRQNERAGQHRRKTAELYQPVAAHFDTSFWRTRAEQTASAPLPLMPQRREELEHLLSLHEPRLRVVADLKYVDTTAIVGDYVETCPAVQRPGQRPIAFIGQLSLPVWLASTRFGVTASEIMHQWQDRLPLTLTWMILQQLWQDGLLTADNVQV